MHVTQHRGECKERNSTHNIKDCYSGLQSLQFSCLVMSNSLWTHRLQHARLPCPSPTPGTYSNSCPSSGWCHPTISSSVVPFSSCLQSLPELGSFPVSQLFTSVAKVLEFQFQHQSLQWILGPISFRMDWVDLLAVQEALKVFSNTTVQKHQFFGAQLSLWSNSHIHTWLLEKL